MEDIIKNLIEEHINPSLSMHDGGIKLISVTTDEDFLVVTVQYSGSCTSCPSSELGTLNMIEMFLREELTAPNLMVKKYNSMTEFENNS